MLIHGFFYAYNMTKEESKLFLNVPEGIDLHDFFQAQLFEYKQFFIQRSPIPILFFNKLDKLHKMNEAYYVLQEIEFKTLSTEHTNIQLVFSKQVLEAFNQWEKEKSKLKQQIFIANDALKLSCIIESYLEITKLYYQQWYQPNFENNNELLSKEPDPMEIYQAILQFNKQGGSYFKDILEIADTFILQKEMKRLSLLLENHFS